MTLTGCYFWIERMEGDTILDLGIVADDNRRALVRPDRGALSYHTIRILEF